jgi:acyl carrier protein
MAMEFVTTAIQEKVGPDMPLSEETTLDSLNLDSLGLVELEVTIAEKSGDLIQFDYHSGLSATDSIGEIVDRAIGLH